MNGRSSHVAEWQQYKNSIDTGKYHYKVEEPAQPNVGKYVVKHNDKQRLVMSLLIQCRSGHLRERKMNLGHSA